jgi:hypothetical protein
MQLKIGNSLLRFVCLGIFAAWIAWSPASAESMGLELEVSEVTSDAELVAYLINHSPFVGKWRNEKSTSGDVKLTFEEVAGTLIGVLMDTDKHGTRLPPEEVVVTVEVTETQYPGVTIKKVEFFQSGSSPWKLQVADDGSIEGIQEYSGKHVVRIDLTPSLE